MDSAKQTPQSKPANKGALDTEAFRKYGKDMVDFIADYYDNMQDNKPFPEVKPGYLPPQLPLEAPQHPEKFEDILHDVQKYIIPGHTHWQHPNFFAYYPTGSSFPSLVGDMLGTALSGIGFTWASSPAMTELEVVMMDWLAGAIGLPEHFKHRAKQGGGGVIQHTASDSTYISLLSAKEIAIKQAQIKFPELTTGQIQDKLVSYCNEQAHSSVERSAMLARVLIRKVKPDKQYSLRGKELNEAIQQDVDAGLLPFFACCTLGTTSICSFDNLQEMGEVCNAHGLWLHVDAAYAGSAFLCEEYRPLMNGIQLCDSFNFNPHKWMLTNFDCSPLWVRSNEALAGAFHVDPLYLQHENEGVMPDFRHWHIPLGRRFRSLKLWFVFRMLGLLSLQEHIRKHVALAKQFEALIREDKHFEIVSTPMLALVCFRMKGDNKLTQDLHRRINSEREVHVTPSQIEDIYFIRVAICSPLTTSDHIKSLHKICTSNASEILRSTSENGMID